MNNIRHKYIKYKTKYNQLKYQIGGQAPGNTPQTSANIPANLIPANLIPSFDTAEGDAKVKRHIALVEWLDYEGANKANEAVFRAVYDPNVVVIMSDGTVTKGIEQMLKGMKEMQIMSPDGKITHEIQFGSGDWLVVSGFMTGTFTGPMKTPDGKVFQPTGKKFRLPFASIEKWKNDKIIEERIFWDTCKMMMELGITPSPDFFQEKK